MAFTLRSEGVEELERMLQSVQRRDLSHESADKQKRRMLEEFDRRKKDESKYGGTAPSMSAGGFAGHHAYDGGEGLEEDASDGDDYGLLQRRRRPSTSSSQSSENSIASSTGEEEFSCMRCLMFWRWGRKEKLARPASWGADGVGGEKKALLDEDEQDTEGRPPHAFEMDESGPAPLSNSSSNNNNTWKPIWE